MESKKSEFLKFCGNDIANLNKTSNAVEKAHILRRIHAQMYSEACKQNYDDYTICKMLSDDLDEYVAQSSAAQVSGFNNMMKSLGIKLNPTNVQPSVDANLFLKSKKCEDVCKNDVFFDNLNKFFNSMKVQPKLMPAVNQQTFGRDLYSNPSNNHTNNNSSVKISVDQSNGDYVFETNFRRKRDAGQNNQSAPYQSSIPHAKENRASENSSNFPGHSSDIIRQGQNTFSNSSNNFSAKRKINEVPNNFVKRSNYVSNAEANESNRFEPRNHFKTASEELADQYSKKHGNNPQNDMAYNVHPNGGLRRSLGGRRTINPVNNKFVPPFANPDNSASTSDTPNEAVVVNGMDMSHPRLKNVDAKMIEIISNEIMDRCDRVEWNSIAGLEYAKKIIMEAVVLPILRPDIFTGLRQPPRGVLLFGPPGTGKTLIGKCIASQSDSTFFSISASSLTSKWIGESEKLIRALFAVAAAVQPSVVFIDEVDSLLCQRTENEHESSRRIKTEFLVQLDGATTTEKDRILIVGATNRPQELDEAARRRFVKRLYIPLPEKKARWDILVNLLSEENHVISESQLDEIASRTDGFSGADMKILCQEALMEPVRAMSINEMRNVAAANVRPVTFNDFINALQCVRASVSQDDLQQYVDWNNRYGSGNGK